MRNDRRLGLDELMIVNPGSSGEEAMFLSEDGTLFQVQGLSEEKEFQGLGQYFLGEDGLLYLVQGEEDLADFGAELDEDLDGDDVRAVGQYFLGADGTLYEVVQ